MPPAVSIITVYHNTPGDLLQLHSSMRKYLNPEQYEFIVVDNASEKNMASELPGVLYLRQQTNGGFGEACNRGAENASAPALFFVNPDCVFVENCVTPLLSLLDRWGVCGPRVIYPDGRLQLSFGPFLSIRNEAIQKQRIRNERSEKIQKWLSESKESEVDYVSGCAMMLRSEIFRKVGGFDEAFFLYQEDVDLCKRIRALGMRTLYAPGTRIVHQKSTSMKQAPEKVSVEYRRSQLYYYKKHHGALQNILLRAYLLFSGKQP